MKDKKRGRPFKYKYDGEKKPFSIRLTDKERKLIEKVFGSVQAMVQKQLERIKK